MELRVLKYFLVVAREENITKAASLLHVTQPTLSRQLMQLEEELGVKLFHRSKYRIILTDDGILLRRRAQEIVDLANKTEQEFQRQEELSGEISIGAGESNSMTALSKKMAAFRLEHPLVRFNIYSATADDIKDRLEKGCWISACWRSRWISGAMSLSGCRSGTAGVSGYGMMTRWRRKKQLARTIWWAFRSWYPGGSWCRRSLPRGLEILMKNWRSPPPTT